MKIKLSKSQWENVGRKAGWIKTSQSEDDKAFRHERNMSEMGDRVRSGFKPFDPALYEYFINLDERGSFFADVRNSSGNTVFEIRSGNELPEGESDIFEDGFMKDKYDLEGLKQYLISLEIMKPGQKLVRGN